MRSATVVCPNFGCSIHALRAHMVFVDRIQIAHPGSKPCGFHWFFRPRLSDLLPLCCPSSQPHRKPGSSDLHALRRLSAEHGIQNQFFLSRQSCRSFRNNRRCTIDILLDRQRPDDAGHLVRKSNGNQLRGLLSQHPPEPGIIQLLALAHMPQNAGGTENQQLAKIALPILVIRPSH